MTSRMDRDYIPLMGTTGMPMPTEDRVALQQGQLKRIEGLLHQLIEEVRRQRVEHLFYMTRDEAADALRVSQSTVDRLIGEGQLRSFVVGRRRFITADAVVDFINERDRPRANFSKPVTEPLSRRQARSRARATELLTEFESAASSSPDSGS